MHTRLKHGQQISAPTLIFMHVKKWPGCQRDRASASLCQGSRLLLKRGISIDAYLGLEEFLLEAQDLVNPSCGSPQTAQQSRSVSLTKSNHLSLPKQNPIKGKDPTLAGG